MIADNRIAGNAGWDDVLLQVGLAALQEDDFDLTLTGFDSDELADLLPGEEPSTEGQTDDDDVPETPETPVSRPGDVWLLGPPRLACGDATTAEAYARLFPDGERADMVFTDPPYNVENGSSTKDKLRGRHRPIFNYALGESFHDFLRAVLTLLITLGLPASVRADPLRLAGGGDSPLVRRPRPRSSWARGPSRWG